MTDYIITEYPKSRVATFDVGRMGHKKHHVAALIEADVSLAKEKITQRLQSGRSVGFTAWIIKVIAVTIAENNYIHAINSRGRSQVVFKDVDISTTIEREVNGMKVPLAAVIKNANHKSVDEIHKEIQSLKNQIVSSEKDYVLGDNKESSLNSLFFNLPQWLRLLIWKIILNNPFMIKEKMGTVMVTNVGISGNISGWILPKSIHNLCFGIGSVNNKPWVYNGKIEIRKIMHLTVLLDHDAVDGSPAARFTAKLINNIENALGL